MLMELRERLAWQAYRLGVAARDRGLLGKGGRWVSRLHAMWTESYLRRCAAADRHQSATAESYPPSFAQS